MSRGNILIVEDEAIVAEDLARKLRQLGYEVCGTAAQGEEAVALARSLRPQLVLMDIRLKGAMDGVEAAAVIHRECDLPVIYLTAHSDRATLERAKLTEPFGYLLKPFEELSLDTHVQMALYKHDTERKLRESEHRVRRKLDSVLSPEGDLGVLELADLVDTASLQHLMDDFCAVAGIPMAILDLKGNVLVAAGWQDICTQFHRVNPETCRNCVESDTCLSRGLAKGESRLYKCKNNMWDMATPIIVAGQHVGNIFGGQFFFDDETVDREQFRAQARRYGFNETEYLTALDRAPRLSRATADRGMKFFMKLADTISHLGYNNAKLARLLSERDRLSASLRESEERLKRAQEIAHLGSWELDLTQDRLTWSDEVYLIFGLEPQQFPPTYEAFLERVHPEDRPAVDAAYSGSVREGRDSYEIEHRIVRPGTGEVRWVHERCQHLRDANGRIIRSTGMVQDVTDRKKAEEAQRRAADELRAANASLQVSREAAFNLMDDAVDSREQADRLNAELSTEIEERRRIEAALTESEERVRLAVESAELGTWETNLATGALNWSHRSRVIFGIADNAPLSHELFLSHLHPDDRPRVLAARQRALDPAGNGRYEVEYRIIWSDRSVRWVVATGRASFDTVEGQRRAVRFVGIMRDVTARKKAEEALQHSNERFRLLSNVTARLLAAENPQGIVNDLCKQVMAHLDCQAFFNFIAEGAPPAAGAPPAVAAVCDRRADGDEPDNRRSQTAATEDAAPGGRLRLNACAGISDEQAQQLEWLDYGTAVCGCAAQGRCRIVAEDIQHTPDPRTELVKGYGIQAYACHPLMAGDRLLGTLSFGTTKRAHFNDDELTLMKTVADQVAVAMDRMQAAQALRRLNRTLHALSNSDRIMVRAETEAAYLGEVCRIVVQDCGHAMVWVGYAEEDDAKTVRPVASAGFEEGYLETLRVTWADTERGRGPTGTAIRTGKPCMCKDILTDPQFAPWREEAAKRGYASSLVLPLIADGKPFGALTIYSREPDPFLESELALLGQLADDLAHGIQMLRLRAARDRAEETVRRSEEQFRAMFSLAAVGMAQADPATGRLLRVNDKLCQITGYSAEELLGKSFSEITHPDDRKKDWDLFHRFIEGEAPDYRNEKRYVRKDGKAIWVLVNANLIRDAAGRPLRTVAAIDDITERKKAEDALRRAKEEWEKTFDSVPDLVAILDTQHRILRANRSMAQKLNLTPDECVGHFCHSCVHGTEKPIGTCPHTETLGDAKEHMAEVSESRLGGDFLVSTTPLFDENRQLIGSVHVARDITTRKKLERELRELNAALEQRVAARTAELLSANQQLQQEVEQRNRANRALRVLSETNEALIRASDETAFLNRACDILVSSGGYRLAWIGFAEQDRGKTIRPVAEAGFQPGKLQSFKPTWANVPNGQRPSALALRTGKGVVSRDIQKDPRFHHWRPEAADLGIASVIALPLKPDRNVLGVLVIAAVEAGAFDSDEVKLLTDLANDLAYAIGTLRARLERQQLQEEVITISEAERRRFGQELHDGLCPQLVAVRFANDMLHKKLSRAGSPLADQAAELTQNLTETVNQARNLSLLLNPVSLEVEGLMAALEKLTADSRQIYRRSVRFVCPQPVLIADNTVATHLYRIAQEAVRNDITHGQATRVTVSLRESRQAVQLTVLSNGLPFPTDLPKSTGMGLKNMRYRAQAIGAQLKISPRPGGGTAVVCTMPVNHP